VGGAPRSRNRGRPYKSGGTGPRSLRFDPEQAPADQTCHSTKRTHRFCLGKQHLSITDTMGYTIKFCRKTVGSFSGTNPPERYFGGVRLRRRHRQGAYQLHQKHHWCISLRSACRRRQRRLAGSAPSDSACTATARAADATERVPPNTSVGRGLRYMCFCETNRIGFMIETGDNILSWNWMRSERWKYSIRFVWNGFAGYGVMMFRADKAGGVWYT